MQIRHDTHRYEFLVETCRTERLKTLAVWAHHRGQLLAAIRAWGLPLYPTHGPTADTGGLPKNAARVLASHALALATAAQGHEVKGSSLTR